MASYNLSDPAITALEDIYLYGVQNFGETQAVHYNAGLFRQFDMLAQFPRMGLPVEWPGKPLLRFGYGVHIIIYSRADEGVRIEHVFAARMDWIRQLPSA